MSVGTPCPIATCCSPVKAGQLLCLAHWRSTPPKLQLEVNRTWRAYGRRRSEQSDPMALFKAYLAARDAAVSYHDRREAAHG